jgi:hypothetical protein
MSPYLAAVLAIIALVGPPIGYVFYESALSPNDWIYQGNSQWADGGYHGAPGPIAGAGLPALLVGGGAYWVVRRSSRKRKDGQSTRGH